MESPINFVTSVIWFLRRYADRKYCTLPHVIELMRSDYEKLFPVLNTQPEIEVLVNPFITAYQIAALSFGEFVGLVADNPDEKIRLKMFHAEIINDADKLN